MDNRRKYIVNIGGIEHEMLMTEQSAKRYGDSARYVEVSETESDAVEQVEEEEVEMPIENLTEEEPVVVDSDNTVTEETEVDEKSDTPKNKGRQTRSK